MKDFLLFILSITAALSTIAILFFCAGLIRAKIRLTDSRLHVRNLNHTLTFLDDQIRVSVAATQQTLVDSLKKRENFHQLDMDEAFENCRERIRKVLGKYDTSPLVPYFGHLDEWINSRIEYHVRRNKISSKGTA